MAKLSVIVAIYNSERYIDKFIENVLAQTFRDFELILSDDGSTDSTPGICDKWASADSRVKVIHKQNGGVCSARNAALAVAEGEYVTFLDQDDNIDPLAYSACMEKMSAGDYDVVSFGVMVMLDGRQMPRTMPGFSFDNIAGFKPYIVRYCSQAHLFAYVWNKVYRRQILEDNNIRFNESHKNYEDAPFNYQVFQHVHRFAHIEEMYYTYFINKGSLSTTSAAEYMAVYHDRLRYVNDFFDAVQVLDGVREEYIEGIWKKNILGNYFFKLTQKDAVSMKERKAALKALMEDEEDRQYLLIELQDVGDNIQMRFSRFCLKHRLPGLLAATVSLRHAFS